MSRTSQILTISLPQEMVRDVEKIAKKERMTKSELFREAFRDYVENRRWSQLRRWGEESRIKAGVRDDSDVQRIIEEYRAEQRS